MLLPPLQCPNCQRLNTYKIWFGNKLAAFYRCSYCRDVCLVKEKEVNKMPTCPACKTSVNVGPSNIESATSLDHWICFPCPYSVYGKCYFSSKKETKKMQYMILRNPKTYENSAPKKFFDTLEQATEVAKKMAIEHRDTFYVIKLIKKVSLPEVVVSVEDL